MNLSKSDFDFIDCSMTRRSIENGCWAMDQSGLWDWLKNYEVDPSRGFMFSTAPEIITICDFMDQQNAPALINHSGASFGITMRHLAYIAKNGFEAYKTQYLESKLKRDEEELQTSGNE